MSFALFHSLHDFFVSLQRPATSRQSIVCFSGATRMWMATVAQTVYNSRGSPQHSAETTSLTLRSYARSGVEARLH
jgi:hypothetical protein